MSEYDEAAVQALSKAGAFCGECGFEPSDRGCPDCEKCWREYVAALREAGWAPRAEVLAEVTTRLANRATLYGDSRTVNQVMRDLDRLADAPAGGAA
jgi:hypothetical protein